MHCECIPCLIPSVPCREGVQFMFECVAGLKDYHTMAEDDQGCYGCILADDMG